MRTHHSTVSGSVWLLNDLSTWMSWRRGRQVEKQQCQSEATVEQWLLSMNACCLVLVGVGVTTHLVHAGGEQHGCSFFESEAPHGVLLSVKTACSKQHHQINHVTCEFRHAHTHTRQRERERATNRQTDTHAHMYTCTHAHAHAHTLALHCDSRCA